MKKLVFLSFVSILSFNALSQLKIGNNPTTINSNSILELESTNKGLLIPRVALQSTNSATPLSSFVAGMLVYNTATTGDVLPGFYVSNGTTWLKLDNQTATTLYSGDGTLAGNRTITQGTNTLAFTSTATTGTSQFTVDGTTLNVDAVNNRIGIGTATPTFPLHVASSGANAGRFEMNSTNSTVGGVSTIELINTNNLIGNYTSIAGKASSGGFSASMEFVNMNGSHLSPIGDIRFVTNNNGTITEKLRILGNGGIRASSLAGSGSRMVVADGSGNLSTQTIPTSTTYTGSTSVTLNGTSFERAALTGDVTATQNSNALTIAANAVTSAKILDGTITAADLNQMSASNGQVLKWNGTAWAPASDEDNSAAISTLQGQVSTLNTQVQVINSTVDDLQGQLFSVSDANTLQNSQISAINNTNSNQDQEIATINTLNSTQSNQITDLEQNLSALENEVTDQGQMIGSLQNALQNPTVSNTITGNSLTTTVNGTTSTAISLPASDGSETKVTAGSNVTVTGAGTTVSPYIVNASGATDATTSTNGIIRLAGDLNGTAAVPLVANNAITSAKIADGTIATADVANSAVTYAKIQNVSANNTLLGRATTGAGDLEEITLGTGLSLSGTTLNAATATTLYSADGTLAGNRTVTQGANTLAFTSTTTNGFSVDGSTFSIDAANNRVGIGTTTPTSSLDVTGGKIRMDFGQTLTAISTDNFTHDSKSMSSYGLGWFSDTWEAGGPTSWMSGYGGIKFFSNGSLRMALTRGGNLGIGNSTPSERLDVTGNIRFSGALMPNNLAGTSGQVLTSAGAGAVPTWSTLPTVTTYTGSTSISLNGTSFERAALTGDVTATVNSNATTIATGAVTSAKILDGTIIAADLNQMSATNGQILKWNGTIWAPAADEDNSSAVSTLQSQVSTLNSQVQVINSTVDDLQGQLFSVSDANTLQNSQISSINNTNNLQDDEIANIISTNDTQDSQIAALQSASNTGSTSIALNGTSFERAALTGDVTASANSNATTIANDAVTYAKMQNVSANNTLLGRATTGAGDVEEITLGTGLSLTGTTLNATTANTLYSADGTLSGNRIVTQGTNTLGFSSTASSGTSHFTVDGTTLNVDAVNNRIGVGTATPTFPLHVASSGASAGRFEMNSTNSTVGGVSTIELINTNNLIGNYTSITGKASSGGFSGSMEFVNTNGSHLSPIGDIRFVTNNNGTITEKLRILGNGGIRASSLSGTGSRMVVADASGNLSTQTIPTSTTYTGSTSIALNGTSFERAALTGDVTATQNSNALTIAANAVTSAKIADGTITAADLNQMSATNGQIMKWNGTAWAAANDENTVADGSETVVTAGSGISISGAGTTASPYVINSISAIATVTADYSATSANNTILCNVPGAGMTLTLPSASANSGKVIVIRKIDNDSDILTFSPSLNYSTTQTISTLNFVKTITVQSNGSSWWVITE